MDEAKTEQPAEEAKQQPKPDKPAAKLPAMDEISQVRVSVAIHAAAAIIMGWVSVVLTAMSRTLVAGIIGIIVMVAVGFITQKAVRKTDRKWWLSNGVLIFLLVWLVSWTVFHNLGI